MNCNAEVTGIDIPEVHDEAFVGGRWERFGGDAGGGRHQCGIVVVSGRGKVKMSHAKTVGSESGDGIIFLIEDYTGARNAFPCAVDGLEGDDGGKATDQVAAFGEEADDIAFAAFAPGGID